jgi:hypothetical protein
LTTKLTLLLIKVTVDVPLDLCVAAILHPWQLFTGDGGTRLVVEGSGEIRISFISSKYIYTWNTQNLP